VIRNGSISGAGIDATLGGNSVLVDNYLGPNNGIGLDLRDTADPSSIYRGNVLIDNAGGNVMGGHNVGDNNCLAMGTLTACP
jgi:hypothetical protein